MINITEIVINKCYGGFGISLEAARELRKRGCKLALESAIFEGEKYSDGSIQDTNFGYWVSPPDEIRTDPIFIALLKEKGSKFCSSNLSELELVEIPDGVKYTIEEYDGIEWIAEEHRTWG